MSIETANQRLAELQLGYAEGSLDYSGYRRGRRQIFNQVAGRESVESEDTRPRAPLDVETTNPVTSPTSTAVNETLNLPRAKPTRQARSRVLGLLVGGAVLVIVLLVSLALLRGKSDVQPVRNADRGGEAELDAAQAAPTHPDPEGALRAFAAERVWSTVKVKEFTQVWRALSVEQRFQLRLMGEFEDIRARAQALLSAPAQQAPRQVKLNLALRRLLKELE